MDSVLDDGCGGCLCYCCEWGFVGYVFDDGMCIEVLFGCLFISFGGCWLVLEVKFGVLLWDCDLW